jgi:hypothetical protein
MLTGDVAALMAGIFIPVIILELRTQYKLGRLEQLVETLNKLYGINSIHGRKLEEGKGLTSDGGDPSAGCGYDPGIFGAVRGGRSLRGRGSDLHRSQGDSQGIIDVREDP